MMDKVLEPSAHSLLLSRMELQISWLSVCLHLHNRKFTCRHFTGL